MSDVINYRMLIDVKKKMGGWSMGERKFPEVNMVSKAELKLSGSLPVKLLRTYKSPKGAYFL